MRSHSALYIDAGYLIAAAATRVTGSSLRRGVRVEYAALLAALADHVESRSGLPLLRSHWYDAARDGKPTWEQEQIALLPKVKLRLGRIGVEGEQKGVDLRIGLDMVRHARNGAVDVIYLVSGDDDLTEAVEEAQAQGVQVIVLAVPGTDGAALAVSRHLAAAADELTTVPTELLDATVTGALTARPVRDEAASAASANPAPSLSIVASRSRPPTALLSPHDSGGPATASRESVAADAAIGADPRELDGVIGTVAMRTFSAWAATATAEQLDDLRRSRPAIPRDLDRALLVDLSGALGTASLSDDLRIALRARLWDVIKADG
jgi:uncharacterized LabA/DUF88 family protein